MTAIDKAAAFRNVLATMRDAVAAHEAALAGPTAGDIILAWDNGLGVSITPDGKAGKNATGLVNAGAIGEGETRIEYVPAMRFTNVRNGHGDLATPIHRRDAIKRYLPTLRESLATFEAHATAEGFTDA